MSGRVVGPAWDESGPRHRHQRPRRLRADRRPQKPWMRQRRTAFAGGAHLFDP